MANEPQGGAALDNSPTLVDYVSDMFGDFSSPEPAPSEDGAPPSEGTENAEGTEGTEAPAEQPATEPDAVPDPSTPATPVDDDPLQDAIDHLAYTVNGESRQMEGITVLKNGGAIVDADVLPKLVQRLSERDNLYERDSERHQQYQALEKATEWKVGDSTLTGVAAIAEARVQMARMAAEVTAFRELLSNPDNIRDLIVGNEDGTLAWNPLGVKAFQAELKNTQNEYAAKVRQAFQTFTQPATPAFDPASLASVATTRAIEHAGGKGFSEQDQARFNALAPRFIRLATQDDARANPSLTVGAPFVEQAFLDMVKAHADLLAGNAKAVSSASDIAKANAAKIAAAKAGARPPAAAKPVAPKQPETERTRDDDFDEAFERAQRAGAAALRAHR